MSNAWAGRRQRGLLTQLASFATSPAGVDSLTGIVVLGDWIVGAAGIAETWSPATGLAGVDSLTGIVALGDWIVGAAGVAETWSPFAL